MIRVSGYSLVVEHILAKDETGVRFSLSAQKFNPIHIYPEYTLNNFVMVEGLFFLKKYTLKEYF